MNKDNTKLNKTVFPYISTVDDKLNKEVEKALFFRACGYYISDIVYDSKKDDPEKMYISKITKKHITPDVRAILFWLENRMPKKWSKENVTDNIMDMSDDDLMDEILKGVKEIEKYRKSSKK